MYATPSLAISRFAVSYTSPSSKFSQVLKICLPASSHFSEASCLRINIQHYH